ncbi:hypothetical protein HPB52_002942 [Rhipicephalus sanguineus]|uniref:adenylate cyclase n=1 Tax=Rhipicephalus sanguineus TaxID=34632 RepID=A0A9D4QFV6_RHISA|nr:hypothetical protein HPB52_002942 [Rhipicephalus sanguineus]
MFLFTRLINRVANRRRCSPDGLNPVLLRFEDTNLESQFQNQPDPQFPQCVVGSALLFTTIVIVQLLTLQVHLMLLCVLASASIVLGVLTLAACTRQCQITCGSTGGEHIIIANNDSNGNFTTAIIEEIPYDCGLVRYQLPCSMLALTAVSVYLRINFLLKLLAMINGLASFSLAFIFFRSDLYGDPLEPEPGLSNVPYSAYAALFLVFYVVVLHILDRQELYHERYSNVAVMFASIPNYIEFYDETDVNKQGLECLRLLNEIICDFDKLLLKPKFSVIEKIKTIGSTYMAAAGLQPGREENGDKPRDDHNVVSLVEFAIALTALLEQINRESFQRFKLRIGINHGPVIAGVVGAQKPQYDIWGNTVNVASRMDSCGVIGRIQVTEDTAKKLQECGYECECRGSTYVKGKGTLTTYFVKTQFDRSDS